MTYHLRAVHPRDAYILAPLLREADKREIIARQHLDIENALWHSITESDEAFVASRPDGSPLAVFGVGSSEELPRLGIPWMVGTDEMIRYKKALIRDAHKWVEKKLDTYTILSNYVDSRNTVHINWLKHLGFVVFEGHPTSFSDIPFYPFYRSN